MILKIDQKLPISVGFKDFKGNDAAVDGVPTWALTDDSLGSLEVAADGLSAVLHSKGVIGSGKVQCAADADLGQGVRTIIGELQIDFVAAEAETVQLTAGEPQPEDAAPAPTPAPSV